MSRLQVTPATHQVLNAERTRYTSFATDKSEPVYREPMSALYESWRGHNAEFFDQRLKEPHLTFGVTPPRALAFCKSLTDWGAELQITLNSRLITGRHPLIRNRWPAEGVKRFLADVLLHEMFHQFAFEVTGKHERSYRGHGPAFTRTCNRIGHQIGLPPVIVRRRGSKDADKPLASHWPHNVRPDDFYLGDVNIKPSRLGRVAPNRIPDWVQLFQNILAFIDEGRIDELRRLVEDELDRYRTRQNHDSSATR